MVPGGEAAGFPAVGIVAPVAAATAAAVGGTVATVCECQGGKGEELQDQQKEGSEGDN